MLEFDGVNKKPLHNGAIEVILFENEEFITAGTDGYIKCNDFEAKIVMNFHSGRITDMAVSDSINMCLSVAEDGCIKLWDFVRLRPIY